MIILKLSFGKENQPDKSFEIADGELLSTAVDRALEGVPLNGFEKHETFNVIVNGMLIEKDMWNHVQLKVTDAVSITPRIARGESGQIFKQALIIAITAAANVYAPGLGYSAGATAAIVLGVTIGATLILNALIPPPVPNIGAGRNGVGDVDSSQMYTISGQSNQLKRLDIVPKVYGSHRLFPTLAATPYTELAVSPGAYALVRIDNITYQARDIGPKGNTISIIYQGGGVAGSEVVTVSGRAITIKYEVGVSTANQIATKVQASAAAMALVSLSVSGDGTDEQDFVGTDELGGGEDGGESVQYLYAIYDCGLGVMSINDIKIGDTPLTTDSFRDFELRLVDPNKPGIDEDGFDTALNPDFKNFKSSRVTAPLSIALNVDGSESIQFSDDNTDSEQQEIILDFVAPRGLYGYSSNGSTGPREVQLDIDFALVGTDDWRPYNDLNYVNDFSSVGGNDVTEFNVQFFNIGNDQAPGFSTYYQLHDTILFSSYNTNKNRYADVYLAHGTDRLIVVDDPRLEVGGTVFSGKTLLGYITAVNSTSYIGSKELVLDRVIDARRTYVIAYRIVGHRLVNGVTTVFDQIYDIRSVRPSYHTLSAAVIEGSRAAQIYSNFKFSPKIPGQYRVRVRRIQAVGDFNTQKEDNITWIGITTAYETSPIRTTKRHCFLELKIKATNQLNGNISNLSCLVSSVLPVYDPDTNTWTRQQTNNPAWILCDLLTGEVNKRSMPVARLHMQSIVEWAEYCDEVPTPPPSQTYLEPRFQANFVLDYESTLASVAQQVTSMGQASLNIIDGKYGVLVDRFKTVPVQIFTPRNSKNFSSTRIFSPLPHGVRVKYIDPQLNWDVAELIVYDNGYNADNATLIDELTSFATTNYEQAWRFGRYMIAQNKLRHETMTIEVDFENLVCTRGDYVQITQDVMRVGGTPARVKEVDGIEVTIDTGVDIDPLLNYGYVFRNSTTGEILTSTLTATGPRTFELDGDLPEVGDLIVIGEVGSIVYDCIVKTISPNDDLSAQITLIEKADGIFDYESSDVLPDYDPQISATSDPDSKPPTAVTNLTVGDNFWECNVLQSGYNYYIELVWDIPFGSVYEFFEIWVNDGRGYKAVATTTSKFYKYNIDQSRLDIEHGIKVVAVAASGKKLELIAMPEVLATPASKTDPPSNVEALNMQITNQVMTLSWNRIADCDAKEYAIRFSPDKNDVWESSIPLAVVAKNVDSISVQARTGVYLIKAIDYNDNQSDDAAIAFTTIPNLFDLNVIETINEAPDFDGVLTQTEKLGGAVILQEQVPGDINSVQYFTEGYYENSSLLDLGDIFSVRLQSQIRADGLKKGELMSDWTSLADIDSLNTALHSDWNASLQYRATDVFSSMADWDHLYEVDHINFGGGVGFTDWRDIPSVGDATGRIFQFRMKLQSFFANVTPRLFDATVKADMPDRLDSFENEVSHPSEAHVISYDPIFKGPGSSPNVQISIDGAETGDYWTFDYKTLEGFAIRFYDENGVQVSRQFDAAVKGYGRRNTSSL